MMEDVEFLVKPLNINQPHKLKKNIFSDSGRKHMLTGNYRNKVSTRWKSAAQELPKLDVVSFYLTALHDFYFSEVCLPVETL